jgi:hypothetical protein
MVMAVAAVFLHQTCLFRSQYSGCSVTGNLFDKKERHMLKKLSVFLGCFILAAPLLSHAFDCNKPEFGARIENLNKDGYFVKYMEKSGISYYNYTGACQMEVHERAIAHFI